VALLEDPIQPVGEHRRDRALAAPGYAHHHDDGSLPRRRTGVFVGFSALSLAQARGWGAPTTRHSPRCPLLMALGHERSSYRWPLLPSAGGSILRVPGHARGDGNSRPSQVREIQSLGSNSFCTSGRLIECFSPSKRRLIYSSSPICLISDMTVSVAPEAMLTRATPRCPAGPQY